MLTGLVMLAALASCGKSDQGDPLKDISAIIVLQRAARMGGVGDVFQYTSYVPGAKLIKVSPPTADGTKTVVCCDKYVEFAQVDIQSYDIAFDARSIVFSAK